MAGIDLLTVTHPCLVKDATPAAVSSLSSSSSSNAAYPPTRSIEVILDIISAHVLRARSAWLAAQPIGRFTLHVSPAVRWVVLQPRRGLVFSHLLFGSAPHPRHLKPNQRNA